MADPVPMAMTSYSFITLHPTSLKEGTLRPFGEFVSLFIGERADNDHDKVYECPDSQATSREKLQYARAYLSHIKPMET
jgi:hypothetical protein